jgi:hypothetical protein
MISVEVDLGLAVEGVDISRDADRRLTMNTISTRLGRKLVMAGAFVVCLIASAPAANAQFANYGGMYGYGFPGGFGYGMSGFGGGFYGGPGFGFGYPMMMGGFGYPGMGYGFGGGYGFGYGYGPGAFLGGYPGYGMPGLWNPLFGVGMSPLGAQSFMYETQVLGRVPRRTVKYFGDAQP